jgi:hypothetical protein
MTNSAKRKGDSAELEAARELAVRLGLPVRRKLGAGRLDDTGDIDGVPDTTIQVKNRPADPLRSIREILAGLPFQQANAGTTFGFGLVRSRGGRWFAVMDLDQIATYIRETLKERTPT